MVTLTPRATDWTDAHSVFWRGALVKAATVASTASLAGAMSPLFPPAPSAGECVQDCLLSKAAELQALALGVGRLAHVVPRHEVHGPPTACCLRLASGAYLRVVRDTPEAAGADRGGGGGSSLQLSWRLSSDGSEPSGDDCVWLARKGGVALHLKCVFTHKQSGLVLQQSATSHSGHLSLSHDVTEDARFRVEAALVAGAVNVQSRNGQWLGVDSGGAGEVGLSAADPPNRRHLLWLLDPLREQARVDAYRQAVAASSLAPMTPTGGDDEQTASIDAMQAPPADGYPARASLTAAAAARDAAEQRASLAYERAAAARERVAAALAEQAAADAAVASARMAAAAAAAAEADLVAAVRTPRELGDEDWVPISRSSGAGDGLEWGP